MGEAPDPPVTTRTVLDEVQAILAEVSPELAGVDADADLRNAGLESLGLVSLIVALETRFEIFFSSSMLTHENFLTPARVASTVEELKKA